MNTLPDETLMARVREGDLDPAGVLFERHHAALYRFFLHTTRRQALAQDLVQDVFVRVLRYRTSYRDGSAVRPWLFGIARNLLADEWKRRAPDTVALDGTVLPSGADSPLGVLEREEQQAQVDAALGRLAPQQRELLALSHLGALTYPEIAALYSITVNAARVRVCRAMKALRAQLDLSEV